VEALTITALGMVSALGCDAATACAAARAGIRRARRLDYFRLRSDGEKESVAGHPVPIVAAGFEGRARLLRLLTAGMADLGSPGGEAAFYLSMPEPHRCFTGIRLVQDDAAREALIGRVGTDEPPREISRDEVQLLLSTAAGHAGWPGRATLRFVSCAGHAGVAEAMERAIADLRSGAVEEAVVGGVDSLLDEDTLQWLQNTGRLKTKGVPAGLQPGEACALVRLRAGRKAGTDDAPLAAVEAVRTAMEPDPFLTGAPSRGTGLVEALSTVAEPDADRAWVICDQNGESYRAAEWGYALCRMAGRFRGLAGSVVWYPAASFGDTGAASGAIAVCLAARAIERGYAPLTPAIVTMCSDGPARGALRIRPPD
jgi:hypothetical protein